MKRSGLIALLFCAALAGCDPAGQSPSAYEFRSSRGAYIYWIDFAQGEYRFRGLHSSRDRVVGLTDCSDAQSLCLSGPFFFHLPRSDLKRITEATAPITVTSRSNMRTCRFFFTPEPMGSVLLRGFDCKYHNGCPNPSFRAVSDYPRLTAQGFE